MVLLGVILVLLAAAAGVLLFVGTAQLTDTVDISVLGGTLSLPPLTLLVTGMVVITLFWLGWALLRGGLRRGKRRRVEAKEAAATAEARRVEQERRMQEEYSARERALVEEHRQHDAQTAPLHGSDHPGTTATGGTTTPRGATSGGGLDEARTETPGSTVESSGTSAGGARSSDPGDSRRS